jgi:hypothetical protein
MPLFKLYPGICLTTEENHRKPQVKLAGLSYTSCIKLAAFVGAASTGLQSVSAPRLPAGDLSLPLVGTSVFQVTDLRGSPHHIISSQSLCP